jgi:hypothetical protein
MTSQPTLAGAKPQMTVFANLAVRSTFPSYMCCFASFNFPSNEGAKPRTPYTREIRLVKQWIRP